MGHLVRDDVRCPRLSKDPRWNNVARVGTHRRRRGVLQSASSFFARALRLPVSPSDGMFLARGLSVLRVVELLGERQPHAGLVPGPPSVIPTLDLGRPLIARKPLRRGSDSPVFIFEDLSHVPSPGLLYQAR